MLERNLDNRIVGDVWADGVATAAESVFAEMGAAPCPAGSDSSEQKMLGSEAVSASEKVIAQLGEAAEEAVTECEAAAVMGALSHTPGVAGSKIAPDVLAKLLPDDEIVVLPRLERVAGGVGYRVFKRAFDVTACASALILLAIPMAVIAFKVKAESPGPATSSQKRIEKDGEVYGAYKFKSMYVDAEVRGDQRAAKIHPRITPFGRFCGKRTIAPAVIGALRDRKSIKSLSHPANSLLELQLCEHRPELCCIVSNHFERFRLLTVAVFEDIRNIHGRELARMLFHAPSALFLDFIEGYSPPVSSISREVKCNGGSEYCHGTA